MASRKTIFFTCTALLFNVVFGVTKKFSKIEDLTDCGGDFSGYQYLITSPNYPRNYSEHQDCTYVLHGSPWAKCNQVFHLQFLNFTLRNSQHCELDSLEIGGQSVICGNVGGIRTYAATNNSLTLRFHSGGSGSSRGFKIRVTTLACSDSKRPNRGKKDCDEKNDSNQEFSESTTKLTINQVQYKHLYPVYRSKTVLPHDEEPEQPSNSIEVQLKQKKPEENLSNGQSTPVLTRLQDQTPHQISAYFFAAPADFKDSSNTVQKAVDIKLNDKVPEIIYKPTEHFALPTNKRQIFNPTKNSGSTGKNQALIIPSRSAGLPAGVPYAPNPGFTPQIQADELDYREPDTDCNDKRNFGVAAREIPQLNIYPGPVTYPATNYGAPGSFYPPAGSENPGFSGNPTFYNPVGPQYLPPRPYQGTNGFRPVATFPGTSQIPISRQCCRNIYSSSRILLASPGFPSVFSADNSYDCVYTITTASSNVCQLRFNFRYFNYGSDDQACGFGYVEIDGRRYCGCKTGLSVVSPVGNFLPKVLGVRYVGYPRSKLTGFVIEVLQEPCGNPGYLSLVRSKKEAANASTDGSNTNFKTDSRTRRQIGYSYPKPSIVFEEGGSGFLPGTIPVGIGHLGKCQALALVDWTLAAKETYLRGARCIANGNSGFFPNVPGYPSGNGGPTYPGGSGTVVPGFLPSGPNVIPGFPPGGTDFPEFPGGQPSFPNYPAGTPSYPGSSGAGIGWGQCEPVTLTSGTISSPLYPQFYSNNVNKCHRFYRSPSSCRLQISFLDFDLENSLGCTKDYVVFNTQNIRYCGRTVSGSKTILEFPLNNIIDLRFVTDSYNSGRGFNIGFMQVACEVIVNR